MYLQFFKFFDLLFNHIKSIGMKKAVELRIKDSPLPFKTAFQQAILIADTNLFIKEYAARACSIQDALAVIMHLLYYPELYEEAIRMKALVGGAVSGRNMLLGALWSQVSKPPKE